MPDPGSPELSPADGAHRMSPTIEEAARLILLEIAPAEVRFLPLACADFFGNTIARRRTVRAALRGRERDEPTGFDTGEGMQLILGAILTPLNGVACEVLTGMTTQQVGRARSWSPSPDRDPDREADAPSKCRNAMANGIRPCRHIIDFLLTAEAGGFPPSRVEFPASPPVARRACALEVLHRLHRRFTSPPA
ncbi:hypothetical protein, partial [Streptosporangium album]|uniref:hypothetical protein n=1 Tax=Streptosporangium album TaxID=47479 RepID=UPI0031E757B0